MVYVTRQAVRQEAGFQEIDTEALAGVPDGVIKNFAVSRVPIVDNNNDDAITTADVLIRVNGVPVDVSEVNPATGVITLVTAPATDDEVTGLYASSALDDTYVTGLITEAEALVNSGLRKYVTVPLSSENVHFPIAKRIATLYAGGFALIRDYGKNTDTEETSKDGYEKLRTAKSLLEQLVGDIQGSSSSSLAGTEVKVVSEGHLFARTDCDRSSHNYFMRKDC